MKRPSFQFYPGDWLRSSDLRSCTVGARGLWIDMLCLMHEGLPYGWLKVGRKVILPPNLARMVGSTEEDVEGWLHELEEAGVFSRDTSGAIYSRRMVRDEEIRQKRAAGGKKGGNPALLRAKDNHPPGDKVARKVVAKDNLPANLSATPASSSSSASASASASASGDPPSPPRGRTPRAAPLVIPEALRAIGIDEAAVERRKKSTKAKKVTAWQAELDGLAKMVTEAGPAAVLATFESAIAGGWQGCTQQMVRDQAARMQRQGAYPQRKQRLEKTSPGFHTLPGYD